MSEGKARKTGLSCCEGKSCKPSPLLSGAPQERTVSWSLRGLQRRPIFPCSGMEQETEAVPRKRKEADSALATELGRPPWDLEDKQPKAKVSKREPQRAARSRLWVQVPFLCKRIRAHPLTSLNPVL